MKLAVATLGGLVTGAAGAIAVALLPGALIESIVTESGLPALLAAAEPPLGLTARAGLALGVGGVAALLGWFAGFLIFGSRGLAIGRSHAATRGERGEGDPVPVLRRADAHPDAPARAPLLATRDLGTPFLEVTARPAPPTLPPRRAKPELKGLPLGRLADPVEAPAAPAVVEPVPAERCLPVDLEQPLSAFDPGAILAVPMPAPVPPKPLRPARPALFDESERFETFEITPPVRPRPAPPPGLRPVPQPEREAIATPRTDATIHALLERLEKGVIGRTAAPARAAPPPARDRSLEDALATLRMLARTA
ncbi:hypothetical protein TPR58_16645 [Sphingomonas sp. HF-S3]|uniref:Uncharacterized protein n=1 Tax=Sphingomonas rustica TaxID=3103142 RepID=A0ABV0BB60_9SPHN